jgi:hypothetical protein
MSVAMPLLPLYAYALNKCTGTSFPHFLVLAKTMFIILNPKDLRASVCMSSISKSDVCYFSEALNQQHIPVAR